MYGICPKDTHYRITNRVSDPNSLRSPSVANFAQLEATRKKYANPIYVARLYRDTLLRSRFRSLGESRIVIWGICFPKKNILYKTYKTNWGAWEVSSLSFLLIFYWTLLGCRFASTTSTNFSLFTTADFWRKTIYAAQFPNLGCLLYAPNKFWMCDLWIHFSTFEFEVLESPTNPIKFL